MNPELIQAIGGAFGVALAGWQALTSHKVRDLETRLAVVEKERNEFRTKLRAAVRHIRQWMAWETHHTPGAPPPELPPELLDEV